MTAAFETRAKLVADKKSPYSGLLVENLAFKNISKVDVSRIKKYPIIGTIWSDF